MTVFLCGFMGCGKSTVGKRLARQLDCPFTDMDTFIEEKAGKTIPAIFAENGEPYFRDLETQAIRELASREGVIACGGGAMLREVNAKIAKESGTVLFLDVPFRICYQRIANTDRPIVRRSTREELYQLYSYRRGIYRAHSTHRIRAIHSPTVTVEEILRLLQPGSSEIQEKAGERQ
ncbi:MAG: shikimate kinase [Oscillospiraceae bacterium]|nr:shikimate kinase [Oscillospiraceae bacterium]